MQNKFEFVRRVIVSIQALVKATRLNKCILGFLVATQVVTAFAASQGPTSSDPAPLAMVKTTAMQITTEFDKNLGRLKGNTSLVSRVVKRFLVPRVDLTTMSQIVVGRYWAQASGATQQRFMQVFTDYVIRTYAAALSSYDGETIKFNPIRGYSGAKPRVMINSQIFHKSGQPLQVQYRVLNKGGSWFIYDFTIDGVSMVENYRAQFAGTLHQGGLALLVQRLGQR